VDRSALAGGPLAVDGPDRRWRYYPARVSRQREPLWDSVWGRPAGQELCGEEEVLLSEITPSLILATSTDCIVITVIQQHS
jgi:hypothetical protein